MQLFKSLIFNILLYLFIIIVLIIALPTLILPNKFTLFFGKFLAYGIIFLLKLVLNCKVIISGKENLMKNKKYFIASAHQSMFETFVLQAPINFPIFILKKELLKIPIFGWYLKKINSIGIIRETTTKENLNFFDKVKKIIEEKDRPLLIFPQGTRTKFGDKPPFKKGIGKIYETLNIACVPVALNSGKVWPKNSFTKFSGDIHIKFLEPIEPGMEKSDFIKLIENKIYSETEKLI